MIWPKTLSFQSLFTSIFVIW